MKQNKHSHQIIYNFGISIREIINNARIIIIVGDTYENNAKNPTVIPAAGIGRPKKWPCVG
jgi:hydrogenase maturation factor